MNSIKAFGKFLDQPVLISKLDNAMPKLMTAGVIFKTTHDAFILNKNLKNKTDEEKTNLKKKFFKNSLTLACAVAGAVNAPKIAGFITKREPIPKLDIVKQQTTRLADEFLSSHKTDKDTADILTKAKEKILSYSDVKKLSDKLSKSDSGRGFLNKLIPEPENVKSKDIFSEIGYLSVYGAIPVATGIAGGVASDIATKDDYKKNLPDKISEGIYQYLANIFLCNIGAGGALAILEKMKITSKLARALGMTAGIILTGVIGGSKIANMITKKIVNPVISPNKKIKERKPEPIDMCMHTDDIATVSVLSGLKWIEPALPVLYSVSGYKAGTGYRN